MLDTKKLWVEPGRGDEATLCVQRTTLAPASTEDSTGTCPLRNSHSCFLSVRHFLFPVRPLKIGFVTSCLSVLSGTHIGFVWIAICFVTCMDLLMYSTIAKSVWHSLNQQENISQHWSFKVKLHTLSILVQSLTGVDTNLQKCRASSRSDPRALSRLSGRSQWQLTWSSLTCTLLPSSAHLSWCTKTLTYHRIPLIHSWLVH